MHIKKTVILLSILFLLFSSMTLVADADTLRVLFPDLSENEYQNLLQGNMIDGRTIGGSSISKYFIAGTEAARHAEIAQKAENGFSIAALSYIPYGPKLKAMDAKTRQLAIFNTIRSISTQEGITYISYRAGNVPKVLIERSSYMADDRNLNNLLEDPVATVFPYSDTRYVYQRDSSFGGNRYIHTYTNTDTEIFVEIKNINALRVFAIFTAVPREQLTINMATYQLEDGLLLSALTTIVDRDPEVRVLGISVDLPSAFRRRITALQNWFIDQLQELENK